MQAALPGAGRKNRAKRAAVAVQEAGDYTLGPVAAPALLRRRIWSRDAEGLVERVVLPSGGTRAFRYNGSKYKLTLRKQMLL